MPLSIYKICYQSPYDVVPPQGLADTQKQKGRVEGLERWQEREVEGGRGIGARDREVAPCPQDNAILEVML